jgi:hypothetical protein
MLAVVGIVSIVAFIRGLQLLEMLVLGISLNCRGCSRSVTCCNNCVSFMELIEWPDKTQ